MTIVPPFDSSRYVLGSLCKRGHDWHGTGRSLRILRNGDCLECHHVRHEQRTEKGRRRLAGNTTHPKNDAVQHRADGSSLIPLEPGVWAIVDTTDVPMLLPFSWCRHGPDRRRNYALTTMNGRTVLMSRFLLNAPQDRFVDHINQDTLDNRRCNLRLATPAQNLANMGRHRDNTSGFKGVHRHSSGLWAASICVNRKRTHIGYFRNPKDAARAYDAKARELRGEFARVNFPDEE